MRVIEVSRRWVLGLSLAVAGVVLFGCRPADEPAGERVPSVTVTTWQTPATPTVTVRPTAWRTVTTTTWETVTRTASQ